MKKKDEIELVKHTITDAQVILLKDFNTIAHFFNYETTNTAFYETGKSQYIEQHKHNQDQIRYALIKLLEHNDVKSFDFEPLIYSIIDQSLEYSKTVNDIVAIQQQRGFKDYGVEGQMRDAVHQLEACKELPKESVLMLRRHEKDFIIRKAPEYVEKLHALAQKMALELMNNNRINATRKEEIVALLNKYTFYFDQLVSYENQLGIKIDSSRKNELDEESNQLLAKFEHIVTYATQKETQLIDQIHIIVITIIIIVICVSIALSFWFSKHLTWKLSLLTENMQSFVESNFEQLPDTLPQNNANDEISVLIENYRQMRSKIILLVYDFKQSVRERVKEIEEQKTQIEIQNEEITSQRDELFRQNSYMEEQRILVERQNREILDSIRYAAGIQSTLLPDIQTIHNTFENFFVFYLPLGIVSGDFYWINTIKKQETTYSVLIAADCTGHGVPGALMSMLGISYLNELIIRQQITCPNRILLELQNNVIAAMQRRSQQQRIVDGMEIGIAVINENTQTLQYAGANRSLYVVRNKELTILHSDKRPIGEFLQTESDFTIYNFNLMNDDSIYLFTDGYTDQFGGKNNKKFTKRSLLQLLIEQSDLPMPEQHITISETLKNWQGKNAQTDDILVIGTKWQNKKHE